LESAHEELSCLHGDVYAERCTACGYEFERNWEVRKHNLSVHDHRGYKCEKCGSKPIKEHDGSYKCVGTLDTNCGTKDTHINFGENLDSIDWNEAEKHCGKADLVIVAGTSMTLRHITHFPFLAQQNVYGKTNSFGKVAIVNLQATPDDDICDLRIFAQTDIVFEGIMKRLGLEIPPTPVWHPRDAKPINQIPKDVHSYYIEKAKDLELFTQMREAELAEKNKLNELLIGNTHHTTETTSPNSHNWKVYVTSLEPNVSLTPYVDKVIFKLHPTFLPPEVSVTQEPFELARTGWGTFPIGMDVYFKNGTTLTHEHTLSFETEKSESVVSIPNGVPQVIPQKIEQTETTCVVS